MARKKTVKAVEPVVEEKTPATEPEKVDEPEKVEEQEEPVTAKDIEKAVKKMEENDNPHYFKVHQKKDFIRMVPYRTPVPMYKLPEDIRKYLKGKGFGTNVYEKSQEWLDKHHADMKMIEKLKKFISENYL
jgi:hypothetical protein